MLRKVHQASLKRSVHPWGWSVEVDCRPWFPAGEQPKRKLIPGGKRSLQNEWGKLQARFGDVFNDRKIG
jgi:hypothetical protein